jgi:mono/diheme cytochrome c family protein
MSKWLRRAGIALGVLVAVALVAVGAAYAVSGRNMARSYQVATRDLAVPADSAAVARGRHLARAIAKCVECHGDDLGGKVIIDDPAIGRFVPTNLTAGRGGVGAALTPADWDRAVRHGVGRDGRSLRFMASEDYATMSDADLGAIIAWARQLPPVDRTLPTTRMGPVIRVMNALGKLPLPAQTIAAMPVRYASVAPAVGRTPEYGRYLANVGGCTGCHGPALSGGHIPGSPPDWKPASNITPTGIGRWSEADFTRALREGKRPGGVPIDTLMPWRLAREMDDVEIGALYDYLRTVPPRAFGNR